MTKIKRRKYWQLWDRKSSEKDLQGYTITETDKSKQRIKCIRLGDRIWLLKSTQLTLYLKLTLRQGNTSIDPITFSRLRTTTISNQDFPITSKIVTCRKRAKLTKTLSSLQDKTVLKLRKMS